MTKRSYVLAMLAATLVCGLVSGLAYAESAQIAHSAELHADSQSDSATLATLAEKTKVEVLQRRGAWTQVKAGTQTGWVRMFNVSFDSGAGATASSSKAGSGLSNLLASGRSSNSGTDTTGVRGLNEEDLNKAQPNPAEFQKMQRYKSDKNVAQNFSKSSHLMAVQLPYLPEPTASNGDKQRSEEN